MDKLGDASGAFDPFDLETAVIHLSLFVERLEAGRGRFVRYLSGISDPNEQDACAEWARFVHGEIRTAVDAAYVVVEMAARHFPDFPVVKFMEEVVFQLDELAKATGPNADFARALYAACTGIGAAYPKFRAPLKLLELRAKYTPEAATESEEPASRRKPGRETKDLPLDVSDALLKRWNQRGTNAPTQPAWAAEAAEWLKDEHQASAPDGELWSREDVIRFIENAQERVRRKRRKRR
jgi:hypothetical protein